MMAQVGQAGGWMWDRWRRFQDTRSALKLRELSFKMLVYKAIRNTQYAIRPLAHLLL